MTTSSPDPRLPPCPGQKLLLCSATTRSQTQQTYSRCSAELCLKEELFRARAGVQVKHEQQQGTESHGHRGRGPSHLAWWISEDPGALMMPPCFSSPRQELTIRVSHFPQHIHYQALATNAVKTHWKRDPETLQRFKKRSTQSLLLKAYTSPWGCASLQRVGAVSPYDASRVFTGLSTADKLVWDQSSKCQSFSPQNQVSERGNESNSSYGKDFPRSYRTPSPYDNALGKTHPRRSKSRQSRAAGSAAAGREAEGALCQGLAGITRSRGRCNARGGSCFLSPASSFANVPRNSELQHGEHRAAPRAAGYQPAQGTKGHRGDYLRPSANTDLPQRGFPAPQGDRHGEFFLTYLHSGITGPATLQPRGCCPVTGAGGKPCN